MSGHPTRRRMLRILGAGLTLPLGALGLRTLRGAPEPVQWHGEVLGAVSGMTLWHPNPSVARRAIGQMLIEIERLERVFSLYRTDSEIARLNRNGVLASPSRDLLDVLDQSRRIADASRGAFDPTIQPLWRFHASGAAGRLDRVRALVDHTALTAGPSRIAFARRGMALSLNGIAQGYITDRITEILGNEGFERAVIELGETRALGASAGGQPFQVGLIDPGDPSGIARTVGLSDAALSVSGGYGLRFDGSGRHHIFDPATGRSANSLSQVAVIAPKAVGADALSTAIYVGGEGRAGDLLGSYPGARAILTRADGSLRDA